MTPEPQGLREGSLIRLRGVRQHNLKNIDLDIPLHKLVAVSGVSGSGKSSLALHTLYAEGQRRYVETFSPYARQFLERMDPPEADLIEGIPPSIAIESGTSVRSSRSTVGTITEINDYLKLLYARLAVPHCPLCGKPIDRDNPQTIYSKLSQLDTGSRVAVAFPYVPEKNGDWVQYLISQGFLRHYRDGRIQDLEELSERERKRLLGKELLVVVDRIPWGRTAPEMVMDSLTTAFKLGRERVAVIVLPSEVRWFSSDLGCSNCRSEISAPPPTPNLFSFNSPLGACPECRGFGRTIGVDPDLVIPDRRLSLRQGAVRPWGTDREEYQDLMAFCARENIPVDVPFEELSEESRTKVIQGDRRFYGVKGFFEWLETKTYKMHVRVFLSRYRAYTTCKSCGGSRYQPGALLYRLRGVTIGEMGSWSISRCLSFFGQDWPETANDPAASLLISEIRGRLEFLRAVGLDYLSLDRQSRTLSGGEVQRVHLTRALGSALVNVLYVLDEPSVGLHARDQKRLMGQLRRLVDMGNSVVVVEHDPDMIRFCDEVIDMGPGGGEKGGSVIYQGPPQGLLESENSRTGAYLAERSDTITAYSRRRPNWDRALTIESAGENNLKDITVQFPLGLLIGVSGVSGSGKSTLVEKTLYAGWLRHTGKPTDTPGKFGGLKGADLIDEVVMVDQQPIGRTPRANLLTYTRLLDPLRKMLAQTPEAIARGYSTRHFSFNVAGGRCELCRGEGYEHVEMQFLADVYIRCPQCNGRRFKDEVLDIKVRGLSIGDMLECTAQEILDRFPENDALVRAAQPLVSIGLDYLRLGQPLSSLSGGEAQRLKLVKYLTPQNGSRKGSQSKPSLFILDEPTTGLHPHDLQKLVSVLHRLVDRGHTVLVVEHNLDFLKSCDWLIDLGPEGGERGGHIVACGPPESIADTPESFTGRFLKEKLPSLSRLKEGQELDPKGERDPLLDDGHELNRVSAESSAQAMEGGTAQIAAGEGAHAMNTPTVLPMRRAPHPEDSILVKGAHEHNLQIGEIRLPRNEMTVLTGLSGSGKSTLAFDVLFAEGQRRYLECLSSYVRQYFKILEKPDVDQILGLPPTVAIEQRTSRLTRKSTVGTITEIHHFLRLLYSKLGRQHCPDCGRELEALSVDQILAFVQKDAREGSPKLLAPIVRGRKGIYRDLFMRLAKMGYEEVRVDGRWLPLKPTPELARHSEHDIELLIADFSKAPTSPALMEEKVRKALAMGEGAIHLAGSADRFYSERLYCSHCAQSLAALDPRLFSFNSRHGACPACAGMGTVKKLNAERLAGHPDTPLRKMMDFLRKCVWRDDLKLVGKRLERFWIDDLNIDPDSAVGQINKGQWDGILNGKGKKQGLAPLLESLAEDHPARPYLEPFFDEVPCAECGGHRLNRQARAVLFKGWSIGDLSRLSISDFRKTWLEFEFEPREQPIAGPISRELLGRVAFLEEVGLDYLALDRSGDTLSGGEAQRIRLAAQLGSNLIGICYILDEPTIGLHPSDNTRLLKGLKELRDKGNTVVVVEHDADTMRQADMLIELGPEAGKGGGRMVARGSFDVLARNEETLTGRWFGRPTDELLEVSARKPAGEAGWLEILGASARNLKDIDVRIPIGNLTCITGVSGAGKSTLVHEVIYRALSHLLRGGDRRELQGLKGIAGHESLQRVIEVDHNPIGRTPRSIPATYIGIWDEIRKLFALLPEARARGYQPGRFSFNVKGGRCEDCKGQGQLRVVMNFLPDVLVPCETCGGARFNADTLDIRYKSRNIADVLDSSVEEAAQLFDAYSKVAGPLKVLCDLGLGYLRLGQPSPTLSGGEAQRIKLAGELGNRRTPTLYILDEPTTGLHRADVKRLLDVLRALTQLGHTVLVIEHNMDLVWSGDYVIDIGPASGEAGGRIVAQGTPEEVIKNTRLSATARALKPYGHNGSANSMNGIAKSRKSQAI